MEWILRKNKKNWGPFKSNVYIEAITNYGCIIRGYAIEFDWSYPSGKRNEYIIKAREFK